MTYFLNLLITIFFFSILTISLSAICGSLGLFSIAHAAFFGVGAYTSAIVLTKFQIPFFVSFVLAILLAGLAGGIISISTGRLKGDYLLIATLGFGEILQSLFRNLSSLTGGSGGITKIPPPEIFGITFNTDIKFLLLSGGALLFVTVFVWCLKKSPLGIIWQAIAEDETVVSSIGKNPYRFKIIAFITSTAIAGGCGALYASYMTYISPENFSLGGSILIFTMMIFGGLGNIAGSILGALILTILPEILRFVGIPTIMAANIRQMLNGIILILIMYIRPKGLIKT